MNAECSMCGGAILVPDDVVQGELISCSDCGVEYEIKEVLSGSVVLKAAEEIKEDWGE